VKAATLIALVALLALLAASAGASAAPGVYRWVDSHGVVHYSDSPPPRGAKKVNVKTASPDPAEAAAKKKARQAKLSVWQTKQAKAQAEAKKAKQKQAQKAKACAKAKKRVHKLAGIDRVQYHGPKGKTTYLSGQQLAAFKQKARERAAKACADKG
jgi:hypothetical protein